MPSDRLLSLKDRHPFALAFAAFLLIALASLGAGWLLAHTAVSRPFDQPVYELLITHHNRLLDLLVVPVNLNFLPFGITPSYLDIWLVLLLGYLALFQRAKLPPALLSLLIAFAMSAVILYLNTRFVFRQRPFTVLPNDLSALFKSYLVHVTSWPSGHTRDTAIFAVITARFVPKLKWPAVIFALFVAFSRVYVGAHYPTDVVGGLLLGWAIGAIAVFTADAVMRRIRREQPEPPR